MTKVTLVITIYRKIFVIITKVVGFSLFTRERVSFLLMQMYMIMSCCIRDASPTYPMTNFFKINKLKRNWILMRYASKSILGVSVSDHHSF
jgi:hypothetical protein